MNGRNIHPICARACLDAGADIGFAIGPSHPRRRRRSSSRSRCSLFGRAADGDFELNFICKTQKGMCIFKTSNAFRFASQHTHTHGGIDGRKKKQQSNSRPLLYRNSKHTIYVRTQSISLFRLCRSLPVGSSSSGWCRLGTGSVSIQSTEHTCKQTSTHTRERTHAHKGHHLFTPAKRNGCERDFIPSDMHNALILPRPRSAHRNAIPSNAAICGRSPFALHALLRCRNRRTCVRVCMR